MRISAARFSVAQSAVFLLVALAAFATRIPALIGVYALGAGVVLLTNIRAFAETGRKERIAAALVGAILTMMLPVAAWRSPTAVLHYAVVLLALGTALVLTRDLRVYLKASRISLVVVQGLIGLYLWRVGLGGEPLETILPDSSSNGITSYLILLQANYALVNYQVTRRASLATAAVTLAICIVGVGRGSILAAGALAMVCLCAQFSVRTYLRLVLSGLLVGAVLLAASALAPAVAEVMGRTKIGVGLYDPGRHNMIMQYWQNLDPWAAFAGGSYEGTIIAEDYNDNPHNSFIRAHHIFGLPYLALIMFLPCYLFNRAQPRPLIFLALGVLAVVVFRAFTEPILFPTMLDFYFFAVCFALGRLQPAGEPAREGSA